MPEKEVTPLNSDGSGSHEKQGQPAPSRAGKMRLSRDAPYDVDCRPSTGEVVNGVENTSGEIDVEVVGGGSDRSFRTGLPASSTLEHEIRSDLFDRRRDRERIVKGELPEGRAVVCARRVQRREQVRRPRRHLQVEALRLRMRLGESRCDMRRRVRRTARIERRGCAGLVQDAVLVERRSADRARYRRGQSVRAQSCVR